MRRTEVQLTWTKPNKRWMTSDASMCVAFNIEKVQRLQVDWLWMDQLCGENSDESWDTIEKGINPALASNGLQWILLLGIALLDQGVWAEKLDGLICCCRSNCSTSLAALSSLNGNARKVFGEYQAFEREALKCFHMEEERGRGGNIMHLSWTKDLLQRVNISISCLKLDPNWPQLLLAKCRGCKCFYCSAASNHLVGKTEEREWKSFWRHNSTFSTLVSSAILHSKSKVWRKMVLEQVIFLHITWNVVLGWRFSLYCATSLWDEILLQDVAFYCNAVNQDAFMCAV